MSTTPADGRILAANIRGPVTFSEGEDGQLTPRRGGGGVVSALSSAFGTGDTLWICAAQGDPDRVMAGRAPGGRLGLDGSPGGAGVRMLDIPPDTFRRAHSGVANGALWFVHHMLYDTPTVPQFGLAFEPDWAAYRAYNRAVAEALAAEAGPPADGGGGRGAIRAIVQDYHLSLVPRMLADLRPDIRIAHFTHTPWAPPDYFRLLPRPVARQTLEGVLGADHAGFHCRRWADAFMDCCEVLLGADVDRARRRVGYRGHVTGVGVHPLGVDAAELRRRGAEPDVQARMATLAAAAGARKLIVRIDRTELSKNIIRGLAAYRELLVRHPEWRGQVTHLLFAYPSRQDLPAYREYMAAVTRSVRDICDEFGTGDWEPVTLQVDDDYPRSLAAYRLADVLLVNPLRDGMNLVAKEGVILSDDGCALVLSTEAGAAAQLGDDALLVNPYDVTETGQALHQALAMDHKERRRRTDRLAHAAVTLPPARWFADQVEALEPPG